MAGSKFPCDARGRRYKYATFWPVQKSTPEKRLSQNKKQTVLYYCSSCSSTCSKNFKNFRHQGAALFTNCWNCWFLQKVFANSSQRSWYRILRLKYLTWHTFLLAVFCLFVDSLQFKPPGGKNVEIGLSKLLTLNSTLWPRKKFWLY